MANPDPITAIILVDHGSRRAESNDLLIELVEAYRQHSGATIVEAAHMELAEPSIATAFGRCVDQGAQRVVVVPYFLGPGRHWHEDIPRLATEAADPYRGVEFLVAAPLGVHPLILRIIDERVAESLGRQQHGR
jgi:sirohydrochlorin ferrochelatase